MKIDGYDLRYYNFYKHYHNNVPFKDYCPTDYKVERIIYDEMNYLASTVDIEDEDEYEKECERLEQELLTKLFDDGYYNFGDFDLLAEKIDRGL